MFYSDHDQVRLATKAAHQLRRYFDTWDNNVKALGELDADRVFDTEPDGGDPRDSLSFTFYESDDNTSDFGFSIVKCLRDCYGIEPNLQHAGGVPSDTTSPRLQLGCAYRTTAVHANCTWIQDV
eukprot:3992115-Amphidinium_carterae.1